MGSPFVDTEPMPKRKTEVTENFGPRLAELRKAAGYTQVELAGELGITQRMVAYYEAPTANPPAHLLPQLAQVLGVGVDVLLGTRAPRRAKLMATNRLERRLMEAQMATLQAQVEPHFLFNTLALIGQLIETDPKEAARVPAHLIEYLRSPPPHMPPQGGRTRQIGLGCRES